MLSIQYLLWTGDLTKCFICDALVNLCNNGRLPPFS